MSKLQITRGVRAIVSVRPANRKLLVIEEAEALFATRGFTGTTVESVARCAGVSVHTVYKLFGNKARLIREVEQARANRAS